MARDPVDRAGTLFVVPTPIGNLEDITLRALRVLRQVALVAAEDTRAARVLLDHYQIAKPTVSCFEGNERARAAELLEQLRAGKDVALITEAGMPAVSDPGASLIADAAAAGVRVEVLPGANAAVCALVGSALPTDEFYFAGFLPRSEGARRQQLGRLRRLPATLVFYEAPARTARTLADLVEAFGPSRPACVARELTKIHEELCRGTLSELAGRYAQAPPRGEVTLVVGGATAETTEPPVDLEAEVRSRLDRGQSPKEIAAALTLETGKPRRQIYQLAVALKR